MNGAGSMAGLKRHVGFGAWKGQLMSDPERLFKAVGKTSMMALNMATLQELPSDMIQLACITEALRRNEEEVRRRASRRRPNCSQEIRRYEQRIQALDCERYPETNLLRQVSGVEAVMALSYVPTVEDPRRFPSSHSPGAYLGQISPAQFERSTHAA